MLKNPLIVFLVGLLVIGMLFTFAPIRIFDGEMILNYGGVARTEPAKFALGEILGIGVAKEDLANVQDYYLNKTGYLLVFLIIIGLPALIAYRVKLSNDNKKKSEQH